MRKIANIFIVGLLCMGLTGCGGSNKACKEIYDEEVSYYLKDAEAMKVILNSDGEKYMSGGTSLFMPNEKEEKLMKSCTYDADMLINLDKARTISKEMKELSELYSKTSDPVDAGQIENEILNYMAKIERLKVKYPSVKDLDIQTFGTNEPLNK